MASESIRARGIIVKNILAYAALLRAADAIGVT